MHLSTCHTDSYVLVECTRRDPCPWTISEGNLRKKAQKRRFAFGKSLVSWSGWCVSTGLTFGRNEVVSDNRPFCSSRLFSLSYPEDIFLKRASPGSIISDTDIPRDAYPVVHFLRSKRTKEWFLPLINIFFSLLLSDVRRQAPPEITSYPGPHVTELFLLRSYLFSAKPNQ